MISPRYAAVSLIAISPMIFGSGTACGQAYPSKPLRILTSPAGGPPDLVSRLIAPGLTGSLGQQVIVDNRAALTAIENVAKAPPDGYALLVISNPFWVLPLMQSVSFDPVKDFSAISLATRSPGILVVHPSLPAKSVRELIALAKARPGELNYASGSTGSGSHLAPELFKAMAGVDIVRIPYKGAGPAINDLIGGQVQVMFAAGGSVSPHVKSGRLRALAVTSAQPSALVPGLPTAAASGLPGYETESIYGVFAPAMIPAAIIARLHQDIVRALSETSVREKFFNAGVETVGSSPEQLLATMKAEMTRLGKVIKDAGIRAE